MIYQIRTYNDLCRSKAYYTTREDIKTHLKMVISRTHAFRAGMSQRQLENNGWGLRVNGGQLNVSIEILEINELTCTNWQDLFGKEIPISNPTLVDKIYTRLDNPNLKSYVKEPPSTYINVPEPKPCDYA